MRQHALDRQMRLAGIGRPEHSGDADAARIAGRGPRKRNGHQQSKGSRNDQVMIRMVIVKGYDAPVAIANTPAGFNECRAGEKDDPRVSADRGVSFRDAGEAERPAESA
jgi:hypothetical protein